MPEFNFVETQDGSLSLRLGKADGLTEQSSESMHSLRGAFSETVYIYGTAIEHCFQGLSKGFKPRILSLGLGLGYVEILSSALSIKNDCALEGESFELVPELRKWFLAWVLDKGELPEKFETAYEDILKRASTETGKDAVLIKEKLKNAIQNQNWLIREALTPETVFSKKFGCICFDAFSSKTSPELWSESFLKSFFESACEPECVLSTYACTGALKRSLKDSGFHLTIREGFSSKRDSTFAVRA